MGLMRGLMKVYELTSKGSGSACRRGGARTTPSGAGARGAGVGEGAKRPSRATPRAKPRRRGEKPPPANDGIRKSRLFFDDNRRIITEGEAGGSLHNRFIGRPPPLSRGEVIT